MSACFMSKDYFHLKYSSVHCCAVAILLWTVSVDSCMLEYLQMEFLTYSIHIVVILYADWNSGVALQQRQLLYWILPVHFFIMKVVCEISSNSLSLKKGERWTSLKKYKCTLVFFVKLCNFHYFSTHLFLLLAYLLQHKTHSVNSYNEPFWWTSLSNVILSHHIYSGSNSIY